MSLTGLTLEKKRSNLEKDKITRRAYRQKNREKLLKASREYYQNNKDKIQARKNKNYHQNLIKTQLYHRTWKTQHKDSVKNSALKTNYGITLEQYNQLLEQQNKVCKICHQQETITDKRYGKLRDLVVDHDHTSNKVRGLLCSHCNTALGLFNDDIILLQNAIKYLGKE